MQLGPESPQPLDDLVGLTTDATTDRAKVEWVVEAQPGATVEFAARHQRAGTVRGAIELR